ncbi:MAG TPA: tRNA lysidine(34) synthetase TilS [Candidatus Limnocylindrales bacterium]|nr:tRNA lysidine(34) synthetase TilS [Candidatus Limnocylindrales bacterium]
MMKTQIQRMVRSTIERHAMVRPGDRVGVAVSGGADSIALLRVLEELRGELGITLCVLHFNHQLRGAESDTDEAFVKSLAHASNLEIITGRANVADIAKQCGWNLEDAARRVRYKFFERTMSEGAAKRVATAHTADDQAETVLARLIRGTGLAGLSSIYPVRDSVIRPFLDVRRADLRAFLAERKQEWREDATNRDTRRLRARVRDRLLPELEQNFSQSIVERLCDFAGLAQDEDQFWAGLVEERYEQMVSRTKGRFSVNANELLSPVPISRPERTVSSNSYRALTQRLIRRAYADATGGEGQLSRSHVEQVCQLAGKGSSGRRIELPGGVTVEREFDKLIFCLRESKRAASKKRTRKNAPPVPSYEYEVRFPMHGSMGISIPELGRSFHLKVIDWPRAERDTRCEGVVLDAERLRAPLVLRNWKPGDAYRPRGRHQIRKLARMFIAGRVAAKQRALWPVLTSAGRVAWADRMPAAEEFSATDRTRTGVWIFEDVH